MSKCLKCLTLCHANGLNGRTAIAVPMRHFHSHFFLIINQYIDRLKKEKKYTFSMKLAYWDEKGCVYKNARTSKKPTENIHFSYFMYLWCVCVCARALYVYV